MKKVFYVKLRKKGDYLNKDLCKEMNVSIEFDNRTKVSRMEEIVKEKALEATLSEWEGYINYLTIGDFCRDDKFQSLREVEVENEALYEEFIKDIDIFVEEKNSEDDIKQDIPVIRTFIR